MSAGGYSPQYQAQWAGQPSGPWNAQQQNNPFDDSHASGQPSRNMLLFYERDQPYYDFTNFAEYPIKLDNAVYPTSEHLFQAFKFLRNQPILARQIRALASPREAFDFARKNYMHERPDWKDVRVSKMEVAVNLKFTQYENLREALDLTGNAYLVEDSPYDSFWGWGKDRKGENMLGKILMVLRAKYRGDMKEFRELRAEFGMMPPQ